MVSEFGIVTNSHFAELTMIMTIIKCFQYFFKVNSYGVAFKGLSEIIVISRWHISIQRYFSSLLSIKNIR